MRCNNCLYENAANANSCIICGTNLQVIERTQITRTVESVNIENRNINIFIGLVSILVIIFTIIFGENDQISIPNIINNISSETQYSEEFNLYNTVESRKNFSIDYEGIDGSEVSFFEKYHVVREIMAPDLPNVIYEKQDTDTQTIYRKRITDNLNFVTIVYKNNTPVTAHSYLMDNNGTIIKEATNYFILDQSSSEYDLAYSSDNTDYNFIYNDSIKKENNSMEYYYRINNGNFTIDYYQKGNFLYSLGFVREGDVMSKRYQYYNDNKIITFEYENFSNRTNIIYRLEDNKRVRFVRNFKNFTLESQENIFYYYDNNSVLSHLYNVDSNLRINYIYDFDNLVVNEIKFTSDWDYRSMKGYGMELKAFNPFYYEKYAKLFGIYDVGVYFESFQFIRYKN